MIYAPVRMHPDGEEFIQWTNVASTKSWVEQLLKKEMKFLPKWVEKYPVIRIGEFEAIEITEQGEQS